MITFSSHGGLSVECVLDKTTLIAFPQNKDAKADIVLLGELEDEPTHERISWPGEYDISGIAIRGIGHDEGQRVSFAVDMDGVRIGFLASPLHDWSDHELELLGNIDILCFPADDPKLAQKLIDNIDPRVLIPLSNGDAKMYEEVLKVSGAQGKTPEAEYKLKGSLPQEGREVVVLKSRK